MSLSGERREGPRGALGGDAAPDNDVADEGLPPRQRPRLTVPENTSPQASQPNLATEEDQRQVRAMS